MTHSDSGERAEQTARRRTVLTAGAAWAAAVLALCAVPSVFETSHGNHELLSAAVVTLGFVISERLVFHIESRNEAVSFSPAEVPLAIGIVLLSPAVLLAVRILGGALGLLIWRKQPMFKFVTNLASFSLEAVVAVLTFRLLVGAHPTPSFGTWIALVAAMMMALLCGGVLIATAIASFENDLAERVRREFAHAYIFYLPGALLGSSAAVCYLVEDWMILIGVMPAVVIWLVLRTHGALMHRYSDLAHIHEFSSQVGRSANLGGIADVAVEEIADHLRAQCVDLVIWGPGGSLMTEARVGTRAIAASIPSTLLDPSGRPIHLRSGDGTILGAELAAHGVEEAIVVGIHHHDRLVATLVVADRSGASDRFTADDCGRLVPITQQLAVAVVKGQLQVEIQHQATHDRLTGLPNRVSFEAWAEAYISDRESVAILLLDLDRFKEVNDTLGHHVGDQLLVEASDRISQCLAAGDMLARLGGDEYAILSVGTEVAEASLLAETISVALEQPFDLAQTTVAIAASIGIAVAPLHGSDRDALVRRADLAMYEAKRMHARSVVFTEELEGTDSMRLALLGELRDAIRQDRLDVFYQPKIDVATNEVIGAEALARWTSVGHGPIAPDVFVPMAAQAGLIGELTDQVMRRAVAQAAEWAALGAPIGVAVNISPQSLLDESLPDLIAGHLERYGLPAARLTLEITEDSVMNDTPRVRNILERLDGLGVEISVDDFGTGHSSLVNLRRMPVQEIKVDRNFVSAMLLEHNDRVIVHSTIDLAHNLGLRVVAEGVETDEILASLRASGCDVAQGFGISRPLSAEHFQTWLFGRHATNPSVPRDVPSVELVAEH